MSEQVKHTPTPWRVLGAERRDSPRCYYVMGFGGDVCDLYTEGKDEHGITRELVPFDNMEANANLIVRAVNNHDALVDFVRKIAERHNAADAPSCHEAKALLEQVAKS